MKSRLWLLWGKWAFMGFSLLAIVMTVASGDGRSTAKTPRVQFEKSAKAAAVTSKRPAQRSPDESHVELEQQTQATLKRDKEEEIGNVFGATSWYVPPPPPPPVKPPPPPKPTAPPMPFTYLGLYEEAPGKVIMLIKGDRIYTVSVGDVIENTYRVERVEQGVVEMTYLPLNIKQSISTGNPS